MWFDPQVGGLSGAENKRPNRAGARGTAVRLRNRARSAVRCRRGVSAVEFAIAATIAIPMLLSALDMAWHSLVAVALDNAAYKASRTGSLGRETPKGTRAGESCQAAILSEARKAGGGLLNGDLQLSTHNYTSAKDAMGDDAERNKGAKGAGLGGHTVVYELRYRQRSIFAGKIAIAGNTFATDSYLHRAVVTVQNEPFSNGDPNAPPCQ